MIGLAAPSPLAASLFDALTAAGAANCIDPNGAHVTIANLSVTAAEVEFDDESTYSAIPAPNVVVHGSAAQNVVDAFANAGIADCDPRREALIICNQANAAPSCGYQWIGLEKVGGSELIPSCGPGSAATSPGGTIDAEASSSLWQSLLAAATAAKFQPTRGTLGQTTVINARYFAWDGSTLGFTLATGTGG